MIINYNSEIDYWKLMNRAEGDRDFSGVAYLTAEFFDALQEKLIEIKDKKEKDRIHNDLAQILSFYESSKKFQLVWARELQDFQNNEGDEWKQNG
jgi:hypothetical protein